MDWMHGLSKNLWHTCNLSTDTTIIWKTYKMGRTCSHIHGLSQRTYELKDTCAQMSRLSEISEKLMTWTKLVHTCASCLECTYEQEKTCNQICWLSEVHDRLVHKCTDCLIIWDVLIVCWNLLQRYTDHLNWT